MVWTAFLWVKSTCENQGQERSQAMSENIKRRMRCAVYTRKSTDEELDCGF